MKTTLTHQIFIFCFLLLIFNNSSGQFDGMKVPYGGQPSEIVSITNTDDNSLHVFAVASGRGLYKLDNTWIFLPVENEQFIRKLIPVNKNLYASFLDSGLYLSKDYAESWIKILQKRLPVVISEEYSKRLTKPIGTFSKYQIVPCTQNYFITMVIYCSLHHSEVCSVLTIQVIHGV